MSETEFLELRLFPRVQIQLPVRVTTAGGTAARARTADVARQGLRIICERAAAKSLHPSGQYVKRGTGAEVIVDIGLKKGVAVRTKCKIMHFCIVDEGVSFGLKFVAIPEKHAQTLEAFIEQAMAP